MGRGAAGEEREGDLTVLEADSTVTQSRPNPLKKGGSVFYLVSVTGSCHSLYWQVLTVS